MKLLKSDPYVSPAATAKSYVSKTIFWLSLCALMASSIGLRTVTSSLGGFFDSKDKACSTAEGIFRLFSIYSPSLVVDRLLSGGEALYCLVSLLTLKG